MKRLFTIMTVVLFTLGMFAQLPQKMSYQAVIRNSSNQLVINHVVGLKISIIRDSPTGTVVYTETQTPTTNENGLISIEIGEGAGFSSIDWAHGPYYQMTEIDPSGGTSYTITGTSQLLSVPYALHSKTVDNYTETDPNAVLLSGDQTVAGNKTFTGTTTVSTPVNATDAVTKDYVTFRVSLSGDSLFLGETQWVIIPGISEANRVISNTICDGDGNEYEFVTIGTQDWLTENLKTTRYNDGTPILLVTDDYTWSSTIAGTYCWYNNNKDTYGDIYGALYSFDTVIPSNNTGKNVCPYGWRVPSYEDLTTLTGYLVSGVGSKLKESGDDHWLSPNSGATNETGFTALPGGQRNADGTFSDINANGFWWANSTPPAKYALKLLYNSTGFMIIQGNQYSGYSVRCIRDTPY